MGHWLVNAFASYGLAVIVVAIYCEGCGVPLPGETVLLAGGFFARQGSLSLGWVLAAAFLAAVAGDNTGYWIGRRGGRGLVERHGRWVALTPGRLESIEAFFNRHGAKTILIARFLSGVRAIAPLFAGISRIPWRRFAAVDAAACLLWATAVGLVGYAFGESFSRIEHWIGRAGLSLLALAAGLLLLRAAERHRDRVRLWVRESLGRGLTQSQLWLVAVELTVLGTLARVAGRVVAHRANHFDEHVAVWLATSGGPLQDGLLAVFAALGSAPAALAVVLLVTGWCFRRARRSQGIVMAATYLVSLALSADLSRALTWWNGALGIFSGLLSGNALVAATAYGGAALLLTLDRPRWRWPAALLAGALVLLVAWARIVDDGDLPSGVLAGLAVSALLLLFATFVIEAMELRHPPAPAASGDAPPGGSRIV
ncbi:MAG TPA: VTT domain-containing protein [Thermoanaerobaculia bacterium]|nr:VTT domain-containing protein [Thermoanaerobaculia bacterium]